MIIIKSLSILYILVVFALIIYGLIPPKKKDNKRKDINKKDNKEEENKNLQEENFLSDSILTEDLILNEQDKLENEERNRKLEILNKANLTIQEVDKYYFPVNVLTENEKTVFNYLIKNFSDKYFILSKVRVADIINTDKNIDVLYLENEKKTPYFLKIIGTHIDFILCDKDDFSTVLAIELDDLSHCYNYTQDKDKNTIFKSEKIPIKLLRLRLFTSDKPHKTITSSELVNNFEIKNYIEKKVLLSNENRIFYFPSSDRIKQYVENEKPKQIDEN